MELVKIDNGKAVTTTLAIAEGCDAEHKAVIQLVRNYKSDLEEFGRVTFEMQPFETVGGTQRREIALLNEHQATTVIMFMRNIGVVKEFKKRLVKAFYELTQQINMPSSVPIAPLRYIELLETENAMLRNRKAATPEKTQKKNLLDDTGVNKMLYEKYLEQNSDKPLNVWWRETGVPITYETLSSALLRNHRKSAPTIGAIARALKFPSHDIRMMLLKLRGGEAAVLLT